MKAWFQIAECSFASAKILQKSEITKRIATFFILSPIFSCEIKIFIVSLQNEEEDKKEKRGGPENKKVVQKRGMSFCKFSSTRKRIIKDTLQNASQLSDLCSYFLSLSSKKCMI